MDHEIISELLGAAIMVYSIPPIATDALAVFPGKDEIWRVQDAVRSWEREGQKAEHLLVANNNTEIEKSELLTLEMLMAKPYGLKRIKGVSIGDPVKNTKDQATFVLEKVRKFKISSITLFVSPYHLLRAYLTLLKMLPHGILLIPAPTPVAPNTCIPLSNNENAWQLVSGEASRIIEYQGTGDVATVAELTKYLAWLWKQEAFSSIRLGKGAPER